jgi:hypothetical protein
MSDDKNDNENKSNNDIKNKKTDIFDKAYHGP